MEITDLSMPIETGHIRWPVERGVNGAFADGDLFEVSWLHATCHGYTHVDAPSHMVPGGPTLSDLQLNRVVGQAAIIDISDIQPDQAVTPELLQSRSAHLQAGDILVFKSCWYKQEDYRTEDYWRNAPYLNRAACEWILKQQPVSVAFDFPQDWSIRRILDGVILPIEEHVSHDVLLRNNITLIEYLINTDNLTRERTFLCAQPLSLPEADGAPARVVAIDF